MTASLRHHSENVQNQYGFKLAARLSAATAEMPYDVSERLRAARMQALAKRKMAVARTASVVLGSGGAASLSFDEGLGWWMRLVSAVPLVVLVMGLVGISVVQTEYRANEVAEVDSALLTDELPPSAYADAGFVHFLKSDQEQTR
ncbi:MAG: DUF3619 family protein [Betaproteobacteria bacterium]